MTDAKAVAINTIFVCPSERHRNALIEAIEAAGGPVPALRSDSSSAHRAHYPSAEAQVIINYPEPKMVQKLGEHVACVAIETADRAYAARRAQDVFSNAGIDSYIVEDSLEEFPKGLLAFLVVPELRGLLMMFWPRKEDVTPEMAATMPKRLPW